MLAVAHAHRVLDWFEALSRDDMPPEWMWPFEDELEGWFAEVDYRRRHPEDDRDRDEEQPMMRNELAPAWRK